MAQSAYHSPVILVADDEPFIVHYIQMVLQNANYGVIAAANGDEAWAIVERSHPQIDLLLTDIVMPGSMDGLELAARVHQLDPNLPVLFITGAMPEGDPRAAGIVEKRLLLRKPFFPNQLIDFVSARVLVSSS